LLLSFSLALRNQLGSANDISTLTLSFAVHVTHLADELFSIAFNELAIPYLAILINILANNVYKFVVRYAANQVLYR
jgi:hypothetical protein